LRKASTERHGRELSLAPQRFGSSRSLLSLQPRPLSLSFPRTHATPLPHILTPSLPLSPTRRPSNALSLPHKKKTKTTPKMTGNKNRGRRPPGKRAAEKGPPARGGARPGLDLPAGEEGSQPAEGPGGDHRHRRHLPAVCDSRDRYRHWDRRDPGTLIFLLFGGENREVLCVCVSFTL